MREPTDLGQLLDDYTGTGFVYVQVHPDAVKLRPEIPREIRDTIENRRNGGFKAWRRKREGENPVGITELYFTDGVLEERAAYVNNNGEGIFLEDVDEGVRVKPYGELRRQLREDTVSAPEALKLLRDIFG